MFWDTIRQNVVFSLRSLRRNPSFTAVAVLTLGVGIGASTAAFSAVDGVVLRPLPYEDAQALVSVEVRMAAFEDPVPSSVPDFIDWQERLTSLEALAAVQPTSVIILTDNGAERVSSAEISPDFLRVLRVSPALGRPLAEDEYRTGAPPAVLISHDSWVRRFGADPDLDGMSVTTADGPDGGARTRRVVGVMPRGFFWPATLGEEPEFLTPLPVDGAAYQANRGSRTVRVIARLAPHRTLDVARVEADAVAAELAATYPDTWTGDGADHRIAIAPLHARVVDGADTKLFIFWGASALLLVIGIVNVANLLYARSIQRRDEISVRTALGASKKQLAGLLLTESLTISLAGGAVGAGFAHMAIEGLKVFGPQILPRLGNVVVDGRVLVFGLALSVLTGFLLGVLPALFSARSGPAGAVRAGRRFGSDGRRSPSRDLLLSFEAALALILLSGSGLLLSTYANLHRQELGFEVEGLATVRVSLNSTYADGPARLQFFEELGERVSGLPGVQAVGLIQDPPVSFYGWWLPEVYRDDGPQDQPLRILAHTITPGYVAAAGIPILRGRAITHTDADGPPVVLLSGSAAASLWPGEDALGRQINLGPGSPSFRVVGIVADVRQAELDSDMRGAMYIPYSTAPLWGSMALMVRMTPGIPVPVPALRGELAEMDANIPLSTVELMTDRVAEALVPARFNASILVTFACVALLLAMVGIYGVLHFLVGQRQREIGVRLALGARPGGIIVDVWRRGMLPTGLGIAVGIAASAGLSRVMASLLFGVPDFDVVTIALATGALALAATLACLLPARRASAMDPLESLRSE
ncbi:MAG: ABC transporter permease [Planctomycetota bacterium]